MILMQDLPGSLTNNSAVAVGWDAIAGCVVADGGMDGCRRVDNNLNYFNFIFCRCFIRNRSQFVSSSSHSFESWVVIGLVAS